MRGANRGAWQGLARLGLWLALVCGASWACAQGSFGAIADLSAGQRYLGSLSWARDRRQALADLPRSVDNRHLLPPVKDQAGCGSCTIYAATALLEAAVQREYGNPAGPLPLGVPTLMEQFTIDCSFPSNGCSKGWQISSALSSLVEYGSTSWPELMTARRTAKSASTESYVPQRAQCTAFLDYLGSDKVNYPFRPFEYQKFSTPTLDEFKSAIREYGAVATALYWARPVPKNGALTFTTTGCTPRTCGGHAIVVVGYDDQRRAFLVRNSWGADADLSEGGHYWISYDEYSPISTSQFGFRDRGFYIIQRRPELPSQLSPTLYDGRPRLSAIVKGTGGGVVDSTGAASLSCAPVCLASVDSGASVTLRARANPGSTFTRWEGCPAAAGPQCTVRVARDTSIAAVFTTIQSGSEFDPGLLAVLGDQAPALINASARFGTNKGMVLPSGIHKFETLTVEEDQIVFNPTFVLDDGRYNAAANNGVSALVIKYLQIPRQRIPASGALEIVVKRPDPASLPTLNGSHGLAGARGANGAGRGQCGGTGGAGGSGASGTAGLPGKSRQYDKVVAISIGAVIDNLGRVIPPEKVRLRFDFGGYDGGTGGNGGNGGAGGAGGQGGDGRSGLFDCSCGPGAGGAGGGGGLGADGGSGGDAGHGANLALFVPQDYLAAIGSFSLGAGRAGSRGLAGVSGVGGSGGSRGSSPGLCRADGRGPGGNGSTPANIVSTARNGLDGVNGDYLYAVLGRANEHVDQLASAGVATDLLRATQRLADVRLQSIEQDRVSVAWTDLNPTLGAVVVQLTRETAGGTQVLSQMRVGGGAQSATLRSPEPGLYTVWLRGPWNNQADTALASLPVLVPGRNLVRSPAASVWSTAGGRSAERIVARITPAGVADEDLLDVYVLAIAPGAGGQSFYFLDAARQWVRVIDLALSPKHLAGVPAGSVPLVEIARDMDLSASVFSGMQFYVGYGRATAGVESLNRMVQEGRYSLPFVIR